VSHRSYPAEEPSVQLNTSRTSKRSTSSGLGKHAPAQMASQGNRRWGTDAGGPDPGGRTLGDRSSVLPVTCNHYAFAPGNRTSERTLRDGVPFFRFHVITTLLHRETEHRNAVPAAPWTRSTSDCPAPRPDGGSWNFRRMSYALLTSPHLLHHRAVQTRKGAPCTA
jgi:hypothetical protein